MLRSGADGVLSKRRAKAVGAFSESLGMTFDLKFYLSIFMRRLPYFLLVTVLVTVAGVSLALILPPKYRAQALLLVETEQIPGDLAASTVRTGAIEGLQIIQQRLLTRANLLEMANRFGIYRDLPEFDPSEIVSDMRERIGFFGNSSNSGVTTLVVSFEGDSAEQALLVTNELVTRALQLNIEERTGRAGQTLDFFRDQVARLGTDLDRQSAALVEFRTAHADSLPDSLDYRRARQAALQERLVQLQREAAALTDRRTRLVNIYERTGEVEIRATQMTPEQLELEGLRAQLSRALQIYTPLNPQVRLLQTRVSALERVVAEQSAAASDSAQEGETLSPYEVQLAEIDGELAYYDDQKALVESALEELRRSIEETPANAARLSEMIRENEITIGQYSTAVESLAQAQTGERIEVLSKGQRINVIEQAVAPSRPYSPQRKLIAAGSLGGGIALGTAVVLLLELTNRSVRRPVEITARLGITPIATLPFVRTRWETFRRKLILFIAFFLAVFGVSSVFYALHTYYLPMDLLVERLLDKTGLTSIFRQLQGMTSN